MAFGVGVGLICGMPQKVWPQLLLRHQSLALSPSCPTSTEGNANLIMVSIMCAVPLSLIRSSGINSNAVRNTGNCEQSLASKQKPCFEDVSLDKPCASLSVLCYCFRPSGSQLMRDVKIKNNLGTKLNS